MAGFIQFYNHSFAIWVLFFALLIFTKLLIVELKRHGKSPKSANIMGGTLAVAAFSLCGVLQVIEMHIPTIAAGPKTVVLVVSPPSQPPIPVEPLEFRQKHEGVFILMGDNSFGMPPVPAGVQGIKDIGRAFLGAGTHEHPSQIRLIASEDQILLNIKFAPIFGMPPLEITNNELSGLPSNWECNHSAKGIEIVNEHLIPIFQMYYKDDTHIVVNGAITFIRDGMDGFVLSSDGKGSRIQVGIQVTPDEFFKKIAALNIKRIFKYPAWQHPGEYAD
jgi:hypothetical protein